MKAETQKVPDAAKPVEGAPATELSADKAKISGSSTPATTSPASTTTAASSSTAAAPSGSTTPQNTQAAAAKGGKSASEDSKGSNLVGKMNNLVTSDLNSITFGRHFMLLCVYRHVHLL